jgi:anaerobic ribonucleoside-triphosphate reductase
MDADEYQEWQRKIAVANRNNIFCHCCSCGYEWVDSSTEVVCISCGSADVEHISCWQFPDD